MTEVYMEITGAVATARKVGPLTAGMVGVPVMFSFSPEWQELNLLAVFRAGEEKKDNEIKEGRSVIPAQVLTQPGQMLCIGVEGRSKDGALVIPTVWAEVGRILDGAQAANDPALAPTPTQFERFMAGLEQVDEKLRESLRQAKESGAFNGTSVTHRWEGTTLEVTSASGTSRADLKGDKGDPGIVNIQDGSALGSLRTIGSKEESDTYTMGWFAFAEGDNTMAPGDSSHAEGFNTTATGGSSHAEGASTTATGGSSHAEGASTTASGTASHAEGFNTNASGVRSHAEGTSTTASGENAHAEGFLTTASGENAHAEGFKTTASGASSHVQGKYNIDDPDGKYAHIVGNGEGSLALSNAHTIDWKGNAWFAGDVYVGGTGQDDPNAKKLGAGGGGGIDVTATPGQIIKVKTVDENGKPTEWEAVDPVCGEMYGDTLTVATITSEKDLESMNLVGGLYTKASDAVPTADDMANGMTIVVGTDAVEISAEEAQSMFADDGYLNLDGAIVIIPQDNCTVDPLGNGTEVTFPEAGVYLYLDLLFNSFSMTIPGYDSFFGTKQLDSKYLPNSCVKQTTVYIGYDDSGVPHVFKDYDRTEMLTHEELYLLATSKTRVVVFDGNGCYDAVTLRYGTVECPGFIVYVDGEEINSGAIEAKLKVAYVAESTT